MDPPSEDGFTADVYSSPISRRTEPEASGYELRVNDFDYDEPKPKKSKKSTKKSKKSYIEDDDNIALWSPAKRQSWESRKTNPNAFYYRHVEPGQVKRTGAWDESEKEAFMKAIKLHPPTQGKWGLFAMNIPGRVGYQCRNFYHRLLESGELHEDAVPGEVPQQTKRKSSSKPKKVTKKKSPKVVLESDEDDADADLGNEAVKQQTQETEVETINENEVREETQVEDANLPQEKEYEFKINSLKLFSTRVMKAMEELAKEEEEPKVEIIDEIGIIEDDDVPPSEIVEAAVETIERIAVAPEPLKWTPRMRQPWKTVNSEDTIVFPHDVAIEQPKFEYQCSKIMKYNNACPLNLLLLSFPAPNHLKNEYMIAIREKLAANENCEQFTDALRSYFQAKNECINDPSNREQICSCFATSIIEGNL